MLEDVDDLNELISVTRMRFITQESGSWYASSIIMV